MGPRTIIQTVLGLLRRGCFALLCLLLVLPPNLQGFAPTVFRLPAPASQEEDEEQRPGEPTPQELATREAARPCLRSERSAEVSPHIRTDRARYGNPPPSETPGPERHDPYRNGRGATPLC